MKTKPATFDYTGQVDYLDAFDAFNEDFVDVTVRAGVRVSRGEVDLSARSAYGLVGANPKTPHEEAIEYFLWDWEYSQSPEVRTFRRIAESPSPDSFASYLHGSLRLGYGFHQTLLNE